MTDYGPEIATHGVRPDFVRDDDRPIVRNKFGDWIPHCGRVSARSTADYVWRCITAIRLKADHPHYLVAKHPGMKMHLGDTRPADYDGSRPVLFRIGEVAKSRHGDDWNWGEMAGHTIIGYYALPPAVPQQSEAAQWAKDRVSELSDQFGITTAFALYVAEHEPEPVDEAVALWLHLCDVAGRNLRDNGDPLEPIALLRAHLAKVRAEHETPPVDEATTLWAELRDSSDAYAISVIRAHLAKVRSEARP